MQYIEKNKEALSDYFTKKIFYKKGIRKEVKVHRTFQYT